MSNTDAHILTKSKSRPFPTVFYFLDTETTLSEIGHAVKLHSLKIGICQRYNRVGQHDLIQHSECIISTQDQFMEWLLPQIKTKSHVYIIAHNVVYDATILELFTRLPKAGYKLQSLYSKGQVNIIRWKKDTSKITLLDNGNIFSGSIEDWGKIFKIPKLKINFDTCTYDELVTYCRRDVEIMVASWRSWIRFIHDNDCGGFRETVGSTAFNTWRHKYLAHEVYIHKDDNVLELERSAYHGGRVEAFHQGTLWTDHYYYMDVNNMYGYVMKSYDMPIGLVHHSNNLPIKRMISYLSRYCVIADVTVLTDEPAFIHKINNRVCYPLGRFRTTLTTNEIIYALEHGWIETLHSFSWYRKANLFADYVSYFHKSRFEYEASGNEGYSKICKLLINALYGKFGQTGINQRIIGSVPYNIIWHMPVINAQTGIRYYQTAIGGSVIEEHHQGESYHAIPAIAAHITANARLYLLSMIKQAGWENVYYCDTDSMIVNTAGYYNLQHLLDNRALGKLKIETQSEWLRVNAPKDYEMSERKKIKGIRTNAVQINDNTYLHEQWIKLAGLIQEGFENGYTSKSIEKHQNRVIYSGNVTQYGKILPFILWT